MGNRIAEDAIVQSKGVIDHFFVRTRQPMGAMVLSFCAIGLAYYLVRARREKDVNDA